MPTKRLKQAIQQQIWTVTEAYSYIRSATLTGSFVESDDLAGISDIDLVVVVDHLNRDRFDTLQAAFQRALEPVLADHRYRLRMNPTLGPLKFNDQNTAVLHLMIYSHDAHVRHAIHSPFTCYDWQRSTHYSKQSLAEVYPVFGLQPHHFISRRRSVTDYLRDFDRSVVSYRQLCCDQHGYREHEQVQRMSPRDRFEFAYHIMRFLMQNLIKLVSRCNVALEGSALTRRFSAIFPKDMDQFGPLFLELRRRKAAMDFQHTPEELTRQVHHFVSCFESQFRFKFVQQATRHLVIRHAPTAVNAGGPVGCRFQGRTEQPILPIRADSPCVQSAVRSIDHHRPNKVYSSPRQRCLQTLALLDTVPDGTPPVTDPRLEEIDYGACEGFTLHQARRHFPELFSAWARSEDPRFPGGGENTADVVARVQDFVDDTWMSSSQPTLTCTHNVVLRCMVGQCLGVPAHQWVRIRIPHLQVLTFVCTAEHGLFLDLEPDVEKDMFSDFALPAAA